VLALPSLVVGAQELLSQPNGFYRQQGYVVLGVMVSLLVWPLVQCMRTRPTASATTPLPS